MGRSSSSSEQVDAAPKQPPKPVREWAVLMGGLVLTTVVVVTLLVSFMLVRRRNRLRALQTDWKQRRGVEKDAWKEAGRRAEAPTAEQLKESLPAPDSSPEAPTKPSSMKDGPRKPQDGESPQ